MSDEKKLSEQVRNCAYIVPDPHPTDTEAGEREVLGLNQVADEISALEQTLWSRDRDIDAKNSLIEYLEQRLAEAGWQPIETAPKDGQRILLGQRGFVTMGYRDHKMRHVCSTIGPPLCPFTHWMHLPPPPPQENTND